MNGPPTKQAVRPTCFIEPIRLNRLLGTSIILASETFQFTGSFKFRAAYHLASQVKQKEIIAASSGNFGQALAYACSLLNKRCTVVMPHNSAKVKIQAIREFGGEIDLIDIRTKTRQKRVEELATQNPEAYIASAFDDPLVIEGNATLGEELIAADRFDTVVVPMGGGGLSSGILSAFKKVGKSIRVIGAEPLMANDAARSLREGNIVSNTSEPQTVADGARTLKLGVHNWAILKNGLATIVEIPEEKILEGVRMLFKFANLKAEPTGALALAALIVQPELFQGRKTCVIVSGGNVDPEVYRGILKDE